MSEVLPPQVRAHLAANRFEAAGDGLRDLGEVLVRTDPGKAHEWMTAVEMEGDALPPLVATYLRWTKGIIFHLTGDHRSAEAELRRAVSRFTRIGRPDLADRARLTLIDIAAESGALKRARRLARDLHRRFEERGDRSRSAAALINLGCAEDAADRILRAQSAWRTALAGLPVDDPRRLHAKANLATADLLAGRIEQAAEVLQEVADEARRRGQSALALLAELNLAEAEHCAGFVDRALDRWHGVLDAARSSGNLVVALAAEIEIAIAELDLGETAAAANRLRRCLPEAEHAGLGIEAARLKRLLVAVDLSTGASHSIEPTVAALERDGFGLQAALLRVETAGLDPHADPHVLEVAARRLNREGLTLRSLIGQAWAARRWLDNGSSGTAIRLAREVLSARQSGPWPRMIAHHVLGRAGGPHAGRELALAVRHADRIMGRLTARSDRAAFLAARSEVYLDRVAFLVARGTARDKRLALDLLDRFRAGWLAEELGRRDGGEGDPLLTRWAQLRKRLAALIETMEGDSEARIRRSGLRLQGVVQKAEFELREVELSLARMRPGLIPGHGRQHIAQRLLQLLPEGHLFMEVVRIGPDIVALQVVNNTLRSIRLRGVGDEVARLIASARFHLDAATWVRSTQHAVVSRAIESTLARLREILLAPLVDGNPEAVWVAPHGDLFHIPWTAIRPELVVAIVPGAGSAADILEKPSRAPKSLEILGVTDPDLPRVAAEVANLPAGTMRVRRREHTSRELFLSALGRADAIHLAGHAVFLDSLPSASALRLRDGWVTVHDLAAVPIISGLVTFGVCSGLRVATDAYSTIEGFLRTLLAKGVRTVVGPIAPVGDDVAHDFFVHFYETMNETQTPGRAFAAAVDHIRATYPNPATWGNFQLYGDPRLWRD